MTESETKHKKEMTKIKNKLDILIKKDLSKIKKLDKKKYYKIFEKFFDDLNSKVPKDLDKQLKHVKNALKKGKMNPSLRMIKKVKKSVKEFKKDIINLNRFKSGNDRVVEYYFYNVLKKYNLEETKDDILFKKTPVFKAYRNLIRKDIKKNDLMRKVIFLHVFIKNEMIKSDKNFKNSMTDEKLIKLYNKLPYRKSIFDIILDTIEYFVTQYPIDFLEYLIKSKGKLNKNDINKIIEILEAIMNINFSFSIAKFMTKEQFISLILSPMFSANSYEEKTFHSKMVDFLSEELGTGTNYLKKNVPDFKRGIITSLSFIHEGLKKGKNARIKPLKHFGFDQNNTVRGSGKILPMFPIIIDFIVENKNMISQLLESISEFSFIKEIGKCKSIVDDIKNKINDIVTIFDLSVNTPDEYINDLRFLFGDSIKK